MTRRETRAPSQRQLRVGEELRHALAWILERGELRDPALAGISVTVTEVRVSPDLRAATAFVTRLGGGDTDTLVAALTHARAFLRRQVGAVVTLKYVPDLSFRADTSFDEAGRIRDLLHDPAVARDLAADRGDDQGGSDGT
ncbi:MAG: 30S ribosome-binding factor RbfA [Rhodospirillales bacterium]